MKASGYTEAMSYLMTFEKYSLDKKATVEALAYLLENTTNNPYEKIANFAGVGVIDSFEFFFGNVDELDDDLVSDEDVDEVLQEFSEEFSIDEMIAQIDRKIAELEKEEELREKEKNEKARKKQNLKNSEEKGRKSVINEEKVGRSAEGINKNIED
jgi:hypothetical protein